MKKLLIVAYLFKHFFLAVLIQIFSDLKSFKTNREFAISKFEKLHICTGLYLAIFLVIHVGAVLWLLAVR